MNIIGLSLFLISLVLSASQVKAETLTYESCTDAHDRSVSVEGDPNLATLVQTMSSDGHPVIRYNPDLLPRLKPTTRVFFYAHACARIAMGLTTAEQISAAQARQADCMGLSSLIGSGLIKRDELPDLQGDLSFSEAEWGLLPGPARGFELSTCPSRGIVKLPATPLPTSGQADWNTCIHRCSDRLYHCGKNCSGDACETRCMEPYRQCSAACG